VELRPHTLHEGPSGSQGGGAHQFELDRIRHEIGQMDGDIRNMVGPIAEHMASIGELKKNIEKGRNTLTQQKANLLIMTEDLKSPEQVLHYGDKTITKDRLKRKLDRDFASYKLLETNVAQQEKLLDAKERSLDATREELSKLVAKKREFEIRLAELETREQELRAARVASSPKVDNGRATDIQASLDEMARRQAKNAAEIELETNEFAGDNVDVQNRTQGNGTSVDEIRNYLQPPAANGAKTASRK